MSNPEEKQNESESPDSTTAPKVSESKPKAKAKPATSKKGKLSDDMKQMLINTCQNVIDQAQAQPSDNFTPDQKDLVVKHVKEWSEIKDWVEDNA